MSERPDAGTRTGLAMTSLAAGMMVWAPTWGMEGWLAGGASPQ